MLGYLSIKYRRAISAELQPLNYNCFTTLGVSLFEGNVLQILRQIKKNILPGFTDVGIDGRSYLCSFSDVTNAICHDSKQNL